MQTYEVGSLIKNHCTHCHHDEQKVIKVVPNEFSEKIVTTLWTQCTKCGQNHTRLNQE
ncbi:hypothetical protein QRD89_15725 [Halobacillus sp. ACCC02827]|uniref:hypothetical protein n=1 Tax=Bacillaceae TaxID=186817 RepID=UPI0002DEFBD7|nr:MULTISPECIES: hypothetical protein [Bacillaceae]QHT47915.1 hypothetical protein M662_15970 [Bacillus sp. SB49]WJE15152.1 hypothetical protein QRD89_15725 [Halobacillus sp. ACCC02827]